MGSCGAACWQGKLFRIFRLTGMMTVIIAALHFPRYSKPVRTIIARPDTVLAFTPRFCEAFQTSHLYIVGLRISRSVEADLVWNDRKPESYIAPFLTDLQARVKKEGIRIGSCECSYHAHGTLLTAYRSIPLLWSPR